MLPMDAQIKVDDEKMLMNYASSRKEDHQKPMLTVPDQHQPFTHPTHPTEMGQQTQVADESIVSSQY